MDNVIARANWSDAFFNYVSAEQAYGTMELLLEEAELFCDANPGCPYWPAWLVQDFLDRI
uniref:Uncharacterized protein n=1 Tax=viral metagenome TaxID=1070528 RepID=A0A6M3LUD5_9ZZZZ